MKQRQILNKTHLIWVFFSSPFFFTSVWTALCDAYQHADLPHCCSSAALLYSLCTLSHCAASLACQLDHCLRESVRFFSGTTLWDEIDKLKHTLAAICFFHPSYPTTNPQNVDLLAFPTEYYMSFSPWCFVFAAAFFSSPLFSIFLSQQLFYPSRGRFSLLVLSTGKTLIYS